MFRLMSRSLAPLVLVCALIGCAGTSDDAPFTGPVPARLEDVEAWRDLTRRTSVDEATRQFRTRAAAHPPTQRFAERYARALQAVERGVAVPRGMSCYRLLLIPGWRYASRPEHGGDLATIDARAAAMGMTHERVNTQEDGVVESNAEHIERRLRSGPSDMPTIVLSVSKGSAETALALASVNADRSRARPNIAAWININGLLGGTPLADTLTTQIGRTVLPRLLALTGGTEEEVESITTTTRRAAPDALPRGIFVVSMQAAPLSAEVGWTARAGYLYLSRFGPNDGITLLADAVIDGAVNLLLPGTDHFLDLPDRDARVEALLRATVEALGPPRGSRCK